MGKKILIFLIAILLIIGIIFGICKIKENSINYEISKVQDYKYFKYNENEKMGIIDKNGNIIIAAQYDDIIIPNLEKDIFICYDNQTNKNKVLNSKNEELFTQYDNIEPIKLKNVASIENKSEHPIARAIVKKPSILILDDSASALDYATDAKLRKAIGNLCSNMTVFIVSQRTASVWHANQILVLEDGRIAGTGTHEQLLKNCQVYQEIYYSQFPKEGAEDGK